MNKKQYKVTFMPITHLQYDYCVEAKNENEAYDLAKEELISAVGYDASKDWECYDLKEDK